MIITRLLYSKIEKEEEKKRSRGKHRKLQYYIIYYTNHCIFEKHIFDVKFGGKIRWKENGSTILISDILLFTRDII